MEISTKVLKETNYGLFSDRTMHPENYPFSAGALKSKKALLLNLSPQLEESERQRKEEVLKCEEFTKCKVQKEKSRSSDYTYIDTQTKKAISSQEYEKR